MEKRGYFIAPASITRRAFAFLLDLILINFVIFTPFKLMLNKIIPVSSYAATKDYIQSNPQALASISSIFFVVGILVLFYFSYMEYKIQQTPGKMILGIHIQHDAKIKFSNYLFSNLFLLPIFPFTLLWIIDPIYLFTSNKNQRLMEKWNGILVLQRYKK